MVLSDFVNSLRNLIFSLYSDQRLELAADRSLAHETTHLHHRTQMQFNDRNAFCWRTTKATLAFINCTLRTCIIFNVCYSLLGIY